MSTILKLARRGIRANLGRLAMTAIAITAGVGFVTGSFILADSLSASFNALFESINEGVDAQVQAAEGEFGTSDLTIPDTLAEELLALPEVGQATPQVQSDGFNAFVALDQEGQEVVPQGPPVLSFSIADGENNGPLTQSEGSVPSNDQEVMLDSVYAELVGVGVGETVTLKTPDGTRDFIVSGLVETEGTLGAAFLLFEFEAAQVLFDKEDEVDAVTLSRAPGVEAEAMIAAVETVLPDGVEARSNQELAEDGAAQLETIVSALRNVLLGFAGVALFVSLFIIYNTFAILITQRLQQIGLLRSLGATGGQVKTVVMVEALLVGLIGSVLGLLGGLGVSAMIKAAFNAVGGFPDTGTVVQSRTVFVAFGVGLFASLASALMPAFAAGRISPVAAMSSQRPGKAPLRQRTLVGLVLGGIGMLLFGFGLAGWGRDLSFAGIELSENWVVLIELALGAILIFLGVAALSAIFAGRAAGIIGRPKVLSALLIGLGAALPVLMFTVGGGLPASVFGWISFVIKIAVASIAIVTGLSILLSSTTGRSVPPGGAAARLEGRLALRNAERSPRRTAATAIALTIGITLVAAVGSVGESLKASLTGTLDQAVGADLFISEETSEFFSADIADTVAEVDGIEYVSGMRFNEVRVLSDVVPEADAITAVGAFNAASGDNVFDLALRDGSYEATVGLPAVLLRDTYADENGFAVGDDLSVELPSGDSAAFTVAGIYTDGSIIDSEIVFDTAYYDTIFNDRLDGFVAASIKPDADLQTVKAEVNAAIEEVGALTATDNQEFIEELESQVDTLITLINYLLGFALFVAFIGVINTIVLSVVERTREIGLLRAVGTTRPQVRSMVRWESVIVCLFGALLGIGLGLLFGWAAVTALGDDVINTLAIPYESIIFTVLVAALAGIVAAMLPAFSASRKNVLEAISS